MDPDEGRNAEVARELARATDPVVPQLNGLPYLDKPIFFFAVTALSIRGLGPTELAARLPSLFFTLATLAILAWWARRRFGDETALLAALILATCPLVLGFARIVIFDAALSFWVTLSCIAFDLARERNPRAWCALAWGAAGVATLTKGPVGLLLPLLVAMGRVGFCGGRLRDVLHPVGLLTYVAVVGPWALAMTLRDLDFLHYALVRETFERVATENMRRTGPPWYFLPLLVGGTLPWILLLQPSVDELRRGWRERRGAAESYFHLAIWVLLPLLFFTISQSKRPGYILPVFPPIAVLCALALRETAVARRRGARAAVCLATLVAVVLLFGTPWITPLLGKVPELGSELQASAPLTAGLLLVAAALGAVANRRDARGWLAVALALMPIGVVLSAGGILTALGEYRSARGLAQVIQGQARDARVVAVETYPHSLAYYLGQTLEVASPRGRELKSNYIAEYQASLRERPGSTLKPATWWRPTLSTCEVPTIFVVESDEDELREELAGQLPLLVDTGRHSAFGPCRSGAQRG